MDKFTWFREAKFGLMVHWGLYSLPAGEWKGERMAYIGEWIQSRFRIPNAEYHALARAFNPMLFDAEEWVSLAQDAGMRYIVFTAKHHEGFAMFRSRASRFNIVDATPFGRDVVEELANACARKGMRLGLYYSQDLDWSEPNGGGYTRGHTNHGPHDDECMAWTNDWDFPENDKKDYSQCFESKIVPQVKEILTQYGELCLIWFDTPTTLSPAQSQTLVDICFAYHEGAGVLDDVSFMAKQGEVTALIGPSGGGKSTACKLAARFWDVNSGKITLGGIDISTIDPETLLKSYSMVFQDVVLFRDTVMENIRLGRRNATDAEVLAAAETAQCDEFIRKLPQGYQTVIGENGSTLSGGERQRISIARALLKDAPIVLLDEATASLDVENETAVQTALSHLLRGKTVLIIAHRMRTVARVDHIVVLENGHVAQQGSPAQLMAEGGLYRRMVELQNESAQWKLGQEAPTKAQ